MELTNQIVENIERNRMFVLRLKGAWVEHSCYGEGQIVDAAVDLISIHFVHDPDRKEKRRFSPDLFKNGFLKVKSLPASPEPPAPGPEMPAQAGESQKVGEPPRPEYQSEAAVMDPKALEELVNLLPRLARRCDIRSYLTYPAGRLPREILLRIEKGLELSNEQKCLLENEQLYELLAIAYELVYESNGILWNAAKAGKYWRMARQPQRVFEIKLGENRDARPYSAVLTNRAGALRDLRMLDEAIQYALQAAEVNPLSHYPYHLLSVLYFAKQDFAISEKYYAQAKQVGAPEKDLAEGYRQEFLAAGEEARARMAEFLLSLDDQLFAWVR